MLSNHNCTKEKLQVNEVSVKMEHENCLSCYSQSSEVSDKIQGGGMYMEPLSQSMFSEYNTLQPKILSCI